MPDRADRRALAADGDTLERAIRAIVTDASGDQPGRAVRHRRRCAGRTRAGRASGWCERCQSAGPEGLCHDHVQGFGPGSTHSGVTPTVACPAARSSRSIWGRGRQRELQARITAAAAVAGTDFDREVDAYIGRPYGTATAGVLPRWAFRMRP